MLRARERWRRRARERPASVVAPGPGQESVWDYPRPPRLERSSKRVRVEWAGLAIADTQRAWRVCETASPPTYYLPLADVRRECLAPRSEESLCEWKGIARYWDLVHAGRVSSQAAWTVPEPFEEFAVLRDHVAFYPGRVDACWLDEQGVTAQPGFFYGGWVTPDVTGPFKGEPGTEAW
ncbi:MAG: DUF427 domain-containing protein [Proteobacteria bacterium]|nr:DUF427 domain-containing protein [Pseudomonadota bacterium]